MGIQLVASEVEERLVEAMRLWQRSPGGGRWPFAGDGPWHLITREARAGGRWDAWRQLIDEAHDRRPTRLPLTGEEVERRDEASGWLVLVAEGDRAFLLAVLWAKASGRRPDWARLLTAEGRDHGKDGLRMRYKRLIEALAAAIGRRARAA